MTEVRGFNAYGVILTIEEAKVLSGKYEDGELQIIECGDLALDDNEKVLIIMSSLECVDLYEECLTTVDSFILDSKVANLRTVCQNHKLVNTPSWLLWVNTGKKDVP